VSETFHARRLEHFACLCPERLEAEAAERALQCGGDTGELHHQPVVVRRIEPRLHGSDLIGERREHLKYLGVRGPRAVSDELPAKRVELARDPAGAARRGKAARGDARVLVRAGCIAE
jgi:hypothetical protein